MVSGDYFVKPEDLRHVPRTSFSNFCQMSYEAIYLDLKEFDIIRNVKLYFYL